MTEYYSENEFDWFLPTPPKPVFLITISDEKSINLNGKLCESIPSKIRIGINIDGTKLGLLEETKGFRVPRNGRVKAGELIDQIKARGVRLPARYLAENINGIWIATLVPPTSLPTIPKKTPNKPRVNGLKTMLPKKEMKR
ncbi:hypothetical protein D3C74_288280 [compost metagenome]